MSLVFLILAIGLAIAYLISIFKVGGLGKPAIAFAAAGCGGVYAYLLTKNISDAIIAIPMGLIIIGLALIGVLAEMRIFHFFGRAITSIAEFLKRTGPAK